MSMESLLYLLEVSKCKSLSKASQNIHITPQALSISIKNLERKLNVQLLFRNNKGVTLTDTGSKLVKLTQNYFDEVAALIEKKYSTLLTYQNTLDIYSNKGCAHVLLPTITSHLYQNIPHAKLNMHTLESADILEMMLNQKIYYAFFSQFYVKGQPILDIPDAINFSPLIRTYIMCYVPDKFPIASKEYLTLSDISNYPLISSNDALNLLAPLQDLKLSSKIYLFDNFFTAQQYLHSELGIFLQIVLPHQDSEYLHIKNIRAIPLVEDIEIYFGYITRCISGEIDPIHQLLLSYINENLTTILQNENVFHK